MISLELEAWHEQLLEFILFMLVFSIVYFPLKVISKERFRQLFPVANALLLTVFTVGCSGQFPFLLDEQAALFSGLHRFHGQLHQNQSLNAQLGDKRFLLVDVSHDLELVPDSSLNATWQTKQLITDRQKLTKLLTWITTDSAVKSHVDMVVCDLTFGEKSANAAQDSALQAALETLNSSNKLLIAQSELEENKSVSGNLAIDTESMAGGSVDITTYYGGKFFTYQLFDKQKNTYRSSLPYVLYQKLDSVKTEPVRFPSLRDKAIWEKSPETKWHLTFNQFVPDFWVDNTDVSEKGRPVPHTVLGKLKQFVHWPESTPDSTLLEATGQLRSSLFYLGQATDTTFADLSGQQEFYNELRDNYVHHKKNIVFIGLFDDEGRDMHETLVGPMHGSLLLLNMFINLLAGTHRLDLWYFAYLFLGFLGVGYLVIQEPYHIAKPRKKSEVVKWFSNKVHAVLQKIANNLDYALAFIVLLGAIAFFNHLINLVIIGVYLGVTKEVFESIYHKETSGSPADEPAYIDPEDNMHA